ncbi:MAG: prepilin-type N-terminal cleavage/methylation domain-containing protein, partial [Nitrospinota bacterium]|nr:prepilin-type N-terminal cleavage/methylation domain-containing protein [Nitrospinota bacterium]
MRKEEKELTWTLSVGKTLNKPRIFRNKGFSLLELILVLFLMGLIAGLALPFVLKTLDRVKIQSEARRIASTLKFARSEAISKKILFTFNANIDQNKYWLAIPKQKKVIQSKTLDDSVRIRNYKHAEKTLTDGVFIINFYPLGNS